MEISWQADPYGLGDQIEFLQDEDFLWTIVHRYTDPLSGLRAEDGVGSWEAQKFGKVQEKQNNPQNSFPTPTSFSASRF